MKRTEVIPRITVPPAAPPPAQTPPDARGQTVELRSPGAAATTESVPPPPVPASAHYVVLEKIGDGGMGVVYLARDIQLGRHVALKRLHPTSLADPHLKSRFFREAKAVAALNHTHIVHLYAMAEDKDGPYIVMEYVAGPPDASPNKKPAAPFTLADLIHRDGPLTTTNALDLMLKVCEAVQYAHSCGVIHRDLKPSNILLNETAEPKIADFGLARRLSAEEARLTVPGEKMLSLGYGAPEQEADAGDADERADVYGLGALLYFSVTGKNPRYFRENDLPDALRAPVARALETDRNARWPSVRELTSALRLIKAPSTVELPSAKTTWRCKWCDTVNPVLTRYCGRCGWDGGLACPECGAETRTGVRFCGACGADAREYETASALLDRMRRLEDARDHEGVIDQAARISGFTPVGTNGRRIIEQAEQFRERARHALPRIEQLREMIRLDLEEAEYERAETHMNEYDALRADGAFETQRANLPQLTLERNLKRVRQAVQRRDWDEAFRTCRATLARFREAGDEARALLRMVRLHLLAERLRNVVLILVAVFFGYVLSAAPAYRALGPAHPRAFRSVYGFVDILHATTVLGTPLDAYARLWGAQTMFTSAPLVPAKTSAASPPAAPGPRTGGKKPSRSPPAKPPPRDRSQAPATSASSRPPQPSSGSGR
jgi:serine/threonine protein kinase